MLALKYQAEYDRRFPTFAVPRLLIDGQFEPLGPKVAGSATHFDAALIDTGAPYVVIPFKVHRNRRLKTHRELGRQPYRLPSSSEAPVLQRFAEVGLRFVTKSLEGGYAYLPPSYVRVKAYLLDADQRPANKVLIGLETLVENFVLHMGKDKLLLSSRQEQRGA
jgi:hypothetical protein